MKLKIILWICPLLMWTSALHAQIVFNELCPNPTNFDNKGGEWIELFNTSTTDTVPIGCWKIFNGAFTISLPATEVLLPNSFYVIGQGTKVSCDSCDFFGLHLDLDLDITTESIDADWNLNNYPGERLVLYDDMGVTQDAILYGSGDYLDTAHRSASIPTSSLSGCSNVSVILPAVGDSSFEILPPILQPCHSSLKRKTNGSNDWESTFWSTPGFSNHTSDSFRFEVEDDSIRYGVYCNKDSISIKTIAFLHHQLDHRFKSSEGTEISSVQINDQTALPWEHWAQSGDSSKLTSKLELKEGERILLKSKVRKYAGPDYFSNPLNDCEGCYENSQTEIIKYTSPEMTKISCQDSSGIALVDVKDKPYADFQLIDDATRKVLATNASGVFTGLLKSKSYLVVVENPCGVDSLTVPGRCLGNLNCPKISGYDSAHVRIVGASVWEKEGIAFCGGDSIEIRLTHAENMPVNSKISFYYSADSSFNPWQGEGQFLGSQNVKGDVYINEVLANSKGTSAHCSDCLVADNHDGCSGQASYQCGGESIELYSNEPGKDISCYTLTDGDFTLRFPPGSSIPADGFLLVGTHNGNQQNIDIFVNDSFLSEPITLGSSFNLANSTDELFLYDENNRLVNALYWGTKRTDDGPSAQDFNGACPTFDPPSETGIEFIGTSASDGRTRRRLVDGEFGWSIGQSSGHTMGYSNSNNQYKYGSPEVGRYAIPCDSSGEHTFFVKGIYDVVDSNLCSIERLTTHTFNVTSRCLSAKLAGPAMLCPGDIDSLLLELDPYTHYTIENGRLGGGVDQTQFVGDSLYLPVDSLGVHRIYSIKMDSGWQCLDTSLNELEVKVDGISIDEVQIDYSCGSSVVMMKYPYLGPQTSFEVLNVQPNNPLPPKNESGLFVLDPTTTSATFRVIYKGCSFDTTVTFGCALPVSWNKVKATKTSQGNLIEWSTFTEINNELFEVEWTKDYPKFEVVGDLPGGGNSSVFLSYSFIHDAEDVDGVHYYRIKQVDYDGRFEYSEVVAVSNEHESIKIWPNPSNTGSFKFSSTQKNLEIKVIDASGRLVYHQTKEGEGVELIDLDVRKGVYYIVINQGTPIKWMVL